ncbi:MAG TPA: methyltransferase [Pirellulales bacterium]|nr:methyltransferase [Pirellulales bacterium]
MLRQAITGYWLSQMVYVAARLGIADLLTDGPKAIGELARATGSHERSLYRLMRGLASLGVFAEIDGQQFKLTPDAEPLRSDRPDSLRAVSLMMGDEHYHAWGELLHSVKTGECAFEHLYRKNVFDYMAERPEQAKTFDAAMTGIHGRETAAMLDAYDLSGVGQFIDVGGGNGSTLAAVLIRYPKLRGTLFDLPGVAERAKERLAAAGVAGRATAVGGSFFESVPSGGDAYLLRHIIHDWDDERSLRILRACRAAMSTAARLLIVESVIAPGNEPSFGKLLDLNMLVVPGGEERTEEEYRALLAQAGFELTRVVPTVAEVSVVEARPR